MLRIRNELRIFGLLLIGGSVATVGLALGWSASALVGGLGLLLASLAGIAKTSTA